MTETGMDRGYNMEERLQKRIDDLHLNYLSEDANLQKLKNLELLNDAIAEYICIVPHKKKFKLIETALVLHSSVERIEDFSVSRTMSAWSAIATYAENLINQPWRVEFREIKKYSGYYKHKVESNLIGGEMLFELMGYKHLSTMESIMVLYEPINRDKVILVSKDALIALVECKIMRSIMQHMVKVGVNNECTWLDVLIYRERNVGSVETAVKDLTMSYRLSYDHYRGYNQYTNYLVDHPCVPYQMPAYHHPPPMYLQGMPMAYGGYINPQQMALPPPSNYPSNYMYPDQASCPNGSFYTIGHEHPRSNNIVPTAQLIELDSTPYSNNQNHHSYSHKRSSSDSRDYPTRLSQEKQSVRPKDSHYRTYNPTPIPNTYDSNVTQMMENLRLDKAYPEAGEASYSRRDERSSAQKTEPVPFYRSQDLSTLDPYFVREQSPHSASIASANKRLLEAKRKPKPPDTTPSSRDITDSSHRHPTDPKKWRCVSCTYDNLKSKEICEMCHKSKYEVQPLISGGSQCPQCTLVNQKGVTECEACGNCLKNSSTYI